MARFTPEEIDALGDLSKLDSAEISKLLDNKQRSKMGLNGNGSNKIILEAELEKHVSEGWDYVRDLPGAVIVRLPIS